MFSLRLCLARHLLWKPLGQLSVALIILGRCSLGELLPCCFFGSCCRRAWLSHCTARHKRCDSPLLFYYPSQATHPSADMYLTLCCVAQALGSWMQSDCPQLTVLRPDSNVSCLPWQLCDKSSSCDPRTLELSWCAEHQGSNRCFAGGLLYSLTRIALALFQHLQNGWSGTQYYS